MADFSKPFLETEITFLKGVGPERAATFAKELNIRTFGDLLQHFPFRYIDRTRIYKVKEITADLPFVQLKGKITGAQLVGAQKGKRLVAEFTDETGSIELVWFSGIKWISPKLKPGSEFIVFGKPTLFNGKFNLAHPELELATDENIKLASKLMPVYSTGENLKSKWLDSKGIWKLQRTLVAQINKNISETLSEDIIKKNNLMVFSMNKNRIKAGNNFRIRCLVRKMRICLWQSVPQSQIKVIPQCIAAFIRKPQEYLLI